jgi:hypothetical protein
MEFTYKKHDNELLFAALEKNGLGLTNLQNYIPIYNTFFELTESNCNTINLNNTLYLHNIQSKETDTIVNGVLKDIQNKQKINTKVFFKYSPLLDPLKYLIGKYDIADPTLLNLPMFNQPGSHEKIRDVNNAAYVDSFFSYLTSKLLHTHKFIHGIDFYGSFLSIKENYPVNVCDDIDYINDFDFFHKNKDILFTVDNNFQNLAGNDTRNYKQKLILSTTDELLQLSDITEIIPDMQETASGLVSGPASGLVSGPASGLVSGPASGLVSGPAIIYENTSTPSSKRHFSASSSSTCSSNSSNSSNGEGDLKDDLEDEGEDDEDEDDLEGEGEDDDDEKGEGEDDDEDDDYSTINGEEVLVKIKAFPVQTIALECCENTLDSLLLDEDKPLSDDEWTSITLQILMTLIAYQHAFSLTHNDLHTNNIMYVPTEKPFLYYKVDGAFYKVPTFGKLFKIIDFGRAIYKFKGQTLCSDSFHPKGDAATQYNFPPYFNPAKPLVEPNFSFDLCRLGCSIYDCIVDDIDQEDKVTSPILKFIIAWCKDDKGRNILYKKNGDERYLDFKLYKMISRKVHNHTPIQVLRNPYFDAYKVVKKKIAKDKAIMNLEELPSYIAASS